MKKGEIRYRDKNKLCVLVPLIIVMKCLTRSNLAEESVAGDNSFSKYIPL